MEVVHHIYGDGHRRGAMRDRQVRNPPPYEQVWVGRRYHRDISGKLVVVLQLLPPMPPSDSLCLLRNSSKITQTLVPGLLNCPLRRNPARRRERIRDAQG